MKPCFLLILCLLNNILASTHYETLKRFLQNYKRPFSVLILGDKGYDYLQKASKDFPNNVFIFNLDTENIVPTNYSENVTVLNFPPTYQYLNYLSRFEQFDVICYCSSHFNNEIFNSLEEMTDYIFLDQNKDIQKTFGTKVVPIINEQKKVSSNNSCLILKTYEHEFKNTLKERSLIWPDPCITNRQDWRKECKKLFMIRSDFNLKNLVKYQYNSNKTIFSTWIPGINLVTFLFFNGIFPTKQDICNEIQRQNSQNLFRHQDDLTPSNLVVSGTKIHLIDLPINCNSRNYTHNGTVKKIVKVINTIKPLGYPLFYKEYWKIWGN